MKLEAGQRVLTTRARDGFEVREAGTIVSFTAVVRRFPGGRVRRQYLVNVELDAGGRMPFRPSELAPCEPGG